MPVTRALTFSRRARASRTRAASIRPPSSPTSMYVRHHHASQPSPLPTSNRTIKPSFFCLLVCSLLLSCVAFNVFTKRQSHCFTMSADVFRRCAGGDLRARRHCPGVPHPEGGRRPRQQHRVRFCPCPYPFAPLHRTLPVAISLVPITAGGIVCICRHLFVAFSSACILTLCPPVPGHSNLLCVAAGTALLRVCGRRT